MLQFNSSKPFYEVRILIAVVSLIGLIHLATFLYRSTPSQMGFDFGWNESNTLYVMYVHPDRKDILAVGDVIQSINGSVPTRGTFSMPTPLPERYELTVLRDNATVDTSYTPIEPHSRLFLDIYISLTIWLLGVAILFVTQQMQWGVAIGGGYIAWALAWLGILSTDSAASWYANAIIFPLVAPLLSASAFYYWRPLSSARRKALWILCGITTLFILANVWEQFYLFPNDTNLESLIGVRLEYPILLGTALAFLYLLFALVRRFRQLEQSFEKQSLAIILIFATLGIVPFMILVIIPVMLNGTPWINPTICYALMAFIPLGFLCAVWREQSTSLEQILTRIVLASSITIIGMLFLLTIQRVTQFGDPSTIVNSIVPAIFLGTVIALYPRTPFLRVLDRLIYGPQKISQNHLQQVTHNLTLNPTWETVSKIINNLAVALDLDGLAVYLRQNRAYQLVAATNSTFAKSLAVASFPSHGTSRFQNDFQYDMKTLSEQPDLRGQTATGYVPLNFSGNNNGILFANYSTLGNADAKTMTILNEVANLLSIGIPAIMVHAAVDEDQAAALYSRELERREIADKIHDGPLQDLIYLKSSGVHNREQLEKVITEIRRICNDLHNPILDFGPEVIVQSIVQEYANYFANGVELTIEDNDEIASQLITMSEEGSVALYHIVSEALNNSLKYANVDSASVYLRVAPDGIKVVIQDSGCGFEPPDFITTDSEGLGLKNMRRWAKLAKGTLEIKSILAEGTTIKALLPL